MKPVGHFFVRKILEQAIQNLLLPAA